MLTHNVPHSKIESIMTFYADLTPYTYLPNRPAALNVGWLDKGHPYIKGQMPTELLQKLRTLAVTNRINQTRGFHDCNLCENLSINTVINTEFDGRSYRLGSAEIWVTSPTGVSYAAPNLIIHYIEIHSYLPPCVFLETLARLKD